MAFETGPIRRNGIGIDGQVRGRLSRSKQWHRQRMEAGQGSVQSARELRSGPMVISKLRPRSTQGCLGAWAGTTVEWVQAARAAGGCTAGCVLPQAARYKHLGPIPRVCWAWASCVQPGRTLADLKPQMKSERPSIACREAQMTSCGNWGKSVRVCLLL